MIEIFGLIGGITVVVALVLAGMVALDRVHRALYLRFRPYTWLNNLVVTPWYLVYILPAWNHKQNMRSACVRIANSTPCKSYPGRFMLYLAAGRWRDLVGREVTKKQIDELTKQMAHQ